MSSELDALATAAASVKPILGHDDNGKPPLPIQARSSLTFSEMGTMGPPQIPRPPPSFPPLTPTNKANIPSNWHSQVSIEERTHIRSNIRTAYKAQTMSYDDLLETCAAIEEELMFGYAPGRLDYFKMGMQFEKRVSDKRKQMNGKASIVEIIAEKPMLKRSRTTDI